MKLLLSFEPLQQANFHIQIFIWTAVTKTPTVVYLCGLRNYHEQYAFVGLTWRHSCIHQVPATSPRSAVHHAKWVHHYGDCFFPLVVAAVRHPGGGLFLAPEAQFYREAWLANYLSQSWHSEREKSWLPRCTRREPRFVVGYLRTFRPSALYAPRTAFRCFVMHGFLLRGSERTHSPETHCLLSHHFSDG